MKHFNKTFFFLLMWIANLIQLTAAPISLQQAEMNAQAFLESKGKFVDISSLRYCTPKSFNKAGESYFVFNIGNNDGYVIAAGDDCAPAILGYSDSGSVNPDSLPDNMKGWLEEYALQIEYMKEHQLVASPKMATSFNAISPLMTTTWDQQDPYNQNCPDFFSYGKCVTGCVATAMAQVMYYHRANSVTQTTAQIPAYDCRSLWLNGSDTLGHIHVDAIPAGSPIDWNNMLGSYSGSSTSTQQQAVANLMKYCGASVEMNYANAWNGGSGASSTDVPIALKNYFNYSDETILKYRSDYSSNNAWENLIYNELSNSRPVYYSGRNSSGGHAFVCDGYDGSGYYHINWGWSGTSDGYFLLTALDPDQQGTGGSSSGYNSNQAALINAQPKSSSPSNPVLATSISLNNTSAELNTGETLQLTATVLPSNATNKTVTWTTSNSTVATVNSNGLVTAKAVGNATIIARTTDGSNLSASCSVTVKQSSVLATSISLNKTSAEINTGGTLQLTATVLPTNATNKTVTWSTSNSSVATVNSNGLVTGHSTGSATITARTTDGTDLSAYCSITVKQNTQSNIISFADASVKALCVQNWDTNGDGELSTSEAAVVTSLGTVFRFNKSITSFNELVYFTGLNSIGNDAFENCSGLTSITIPESVTSIGSSAFDHCSGLTSITIPSSMTSIGSCAFDNCSGLTSITIPSSVTSIGNAAFSYCESISSITVSSNNTVYDSRGNCNAIIKKSNNELIVGCKNTVIPSSVTSIGNSAFSGCHGMTSITIPSSVKSIGRYAFTWCSSLTSISIPSSVTSIESTAFDGCAGLSSITVSSNNTVYDSRDNCNAIIKKSNNILIRGCKNTVFPSSVTGIGEYAFFGCTSITSITIPSNVTSIGEEAFTRCDYLASVTIPSTMISIGNRAFSLCFRLTSVTCLASIPPTIGNAYTFYHPDKATLYVPAGKKSAYQNADYWKEFSQIIELPVLATSISLNKTSAELIEGNTMQLTATVLPSNATNKTVTWTTSNSSVATVSSNGLVTAKAVGNATITARTTDGSNLSASCSVTVEQSSVLATSISLNKTSAELNTGGTLQLTATVLPSNATNKAVTWTTSNSSVATVSSNGLVTAKNPGNATITARTTDGSNLSATCYITVLNSSIISFADASVKALCVQNWDTDGDGELSIAEAAAVTDLGSVFKSNKNITAFGELQYFLGLTSIGYSAFSDCSGLTSITIPNSVTTIGDYAFYSCRSLKNVTIPNSVMYIYDGAFSECSGLTSVTIGNSVTGIWKWAFSGCTALNTVNFNAVSCAYDIPNSYISDFHPFSNTNISTINIGNSVQKIPDYFAYGNTNLTSIDISNSVTTIGDNAFSGCSGLTSVAIPNSVTEIGNNAFSGCSGLTNVTIGNSVTTIGTSAFIDCSALTSVTIPNSVISIGEWAFYGCSGLKNVKILDLDAWCKISFSTSSSNPLQYGHHLFINDEEITDLVIPNSVTSIGGYAFYGCSGLTSVTIPNSVTTICDYAFSGCSGLTSITVASGNIKYDSRNNCNGIIETASNKLITGCKNTTIPNSVTSIGGYAFYGCSGLTSVTIPNSVTTIRYDAFSGCNGLNDVFSFIDNPTSVNMGSDVFYLDSGNYAERTLHVPAGSLASYQNSSTWNPYFGTIVEMEPEVILASSISLDKTSAELTEGNTMQLTATVLPSNATNKAVTWSTSNSTVATVNSNGLVTALTPGSAIITASTTDGTNLSATCAITVKQQVILATSISLDKTSVQLTEGERTQLIATVLPSNTTNKTLVWSTNNSEVVTVGRYDGKLFAKTPGTATITVKTMDGSNLSAFCEVSVAELTGVTFRMDNIEACSGDTVSIPIQLDNDKMVNGFQIDFYYPEGFEIINCSATDRFLPEATVLFSNYMEDNFCRSVAVSTSTNLVLDAGNGPIVNIDMKIPDDASGDYEISLKNIVINVVDNENIIYDYRPSDVSANLKVLESILATSIILDQTTAHLAKGGTLQLTATVLPDNATNKTVNWYSSNTNVATVNSDGLVTALAEGTATIIATTTDGTNLYASCTVSVYVQATSITLSSSFLTLNVNETTQLTATITPSNATNQALTWTSSNPSIATVNANGVVTTLSPGTTTITATTTDGSNLSASCYVVVVQLASSITLNETNLSLNVNQTAQLNATVYPSNTGNKTVTWKSSNAAVATVSNNGLVTALADGTAIITATTTDGTNLSASCQVTVSSVPVTSISLNSSGIILDLGDQQTYQLVPTILPSNATNQAVTWTSSNPAVAIVTNNGLVIPISQGNATVTVTTTDGTNLSASCQVTVIKRVKSISLSETNLTITLPETVRLTATITPSDATNQVLNWTSSKPSVAIVDNRGVVTSVGVGTTTIKATTTDGTNLSASCQVTVVKQNVTSITLNESNLVMSSGETTQLIATVLPDNASNKTLSWTSGNTAVATVDNNGLVTAISGGTTYVTATTTDGSNLSARCTIEVLPDYYLTLDTLSHIRGEAAQIVDLPVTLVNKNAISGIQFDVTLPTGVEFYLVDDMPDVWLDDARSTRSHSVTASQLSNGKYRVLVTSSSSKDLKGNDGELVHMNLLLSKIHDSGNYNITVSNIIASESNETRHTLANTSTVVHFYYIVGDADANAFVDIADHAATASKILGKTPSPFYYDAANVDANSSLDVVDLVGITNIALEIKPTTVRQAPARESVENRLFCDKLNLNSAGEKDITIGMDCGFYFAGFQMDVSLPSGLTLVDATLGDDASGLSLAVATMPDGTVRILGTSFSDAEISGVCPELLKLRVKAEYGFSTSSQIEFSDILFAERNLASHALDDLSVEYVEPSAVHEIMDDVRIYVEKGHIIVDTPVAGAVQLIAVDGRMVEYQAQVGRNEYVVGGNTIYIVHFDGKTVSKTLKVRL